MSIYVVDPGELIDFTIDWDDDGTGGDDVLNTGSPAETISTSTWSLDPENSGEASLQSSSKTDTTATTFLDGAVLGDLYRLKNTITTSEGRTLTRSVLVKVAAL